MNTSPENRNNDTREVIHNTMGVPKAQETIEYVEAFKEIQDDLKFMFDIHVENEEDLSSPNIKDELYSKVIEDLNAGKPFALDYMFEEKINGKQLLSCEDLQVRGIQEMKSQAREILAKIKGPIGRRMKDLIVNVGILTNEEADTIFIAS